MTLDFALGMLSCSLVCLITYLLHGATQAWIDSRVIKALTERTSRR